MDETVDIAVVGAGAAGLMAAIQAARAAPGLGVAALDGADRLGAKIRIAGGGRCNVTHEVVTEKDFAGGSPNAIRKVLKAFGVEATVAFFADLGVTLKREETGKLFPTTDRAQTIVDALLAAARDAGVRLLHPFRVEAVARREGAFLCEGPEGRVRARRVVLATGGRSVPQTGSDGHGYAIARALGHTTTPLVQALVPLCLPAGHPLTKIKGIATPVALEVRGGNRRRLVRVEGALLCTHFGLSGPAVLDVSRHWILAKEADAGAALVVAWLPTLGREAIEAALLDLGRRRVAAWLGEHLPARLAEVLLAAAGVRADTEGHHLAKDARRALVTVLHEMPLPVTGPRGWAYAEVTAGGVPLTEVKVETMASRACEGLHLCGEILDVDGRIGGFNFQWAWASGTAAGRGAALSANACGGPGHGGGRRPGG